MTIEGQQKNHYHLGITSTRPDAPMPPAQMSSRGITPIFTAMMGNHDSIGPESKVGGRRDM
jgi:hypothetical protein